MNKEEGIEQFLKTEEGHVSLLKLRQRAMGDIPEEALNEDESYMYVGYFAGYKDGIVAANLEALSKIDPEKADKFTENFLRAIVDNGVEVNGEEVETGNNEVIDGDE